MDKLPSDMNWDNFADYISEKYNWYAETTDTYFKLPKSKNPYRRIDHILSDFYIEGDKITLQIQKGDSFVDGLKGLVVVLSTAIRKKYDCFFTIEEVDYF